jgi:hypothetical protein
MQVNVEYVIFVSFPVRSARYNNQRVMLYSTGVLYTKPSNIQYIWEKILERILVPISGMYSLLEQKKQELFSKETNVTSIEKVDSYMAPCCSSI